MAETDNPLKRLLHIAIEDFAAWLFGEEVLSADTVNIELPSTDPIRTDQLFRVALANGRTGLLHIEFQGRSSRKPMKWRMLDYITRIAEIERGVDLLSVVFYIGQGTGARDTGEHQVNGPDGSITLKWRYRVIHLWKLRAQDLLALGRFGVLPLIGQTRIEEAKQLAPTVVERLKQVEDPEQQGRLFTSLLALIEDEELLTMIQTMIEEEELLMNTPFLRRIREEGRIQGAQMTRRQDILDTLIWRFDPSAAFYRDVQKILANIHEDADLERLFATAVRAPSLNDFQSALNQSTSSTKSNGNA